MSKHSVDTEIGAEAAQPITGLNSAFSFPSTIRLRSARQFRAIYEAGVRAGDAHLLSFAAANNLSTTRVGLSVSKKHGNAPARNRKKRLMREAFRQIRNEIPAGLDLILVPRQRTDSTVKDFQASLFRLSKKLSTRLTLLENSTQALTTPATETVAKQPASDNGEPHVS